MAPNEQGPIESLFKEFLTDRKAQNLTEGTIHFYEVKIKKFLQFTTKKDVYDLGGVTPNLIREFLIELEPDHQPSGVHAYFRTLRTFLYWFEREYEPEKWKNPIRKVRAPKVPKQAVVPVSNETVMAMANICPKTTYAGVRDRAMILTLLDTGVRARELLNMDLDDIQDSLNEILIPRGKGGKPRTVFLGRASKKALRAHLNNVKTKEGPVWLSRDGDRLSYWGLKDVMPRPLPPGEG